MSDFGGGYKSHEFDNLLKILGIKIRTSVPHIHQQNGHAEHFNRTLMDKAQALRLDACLPQSWWEFAVNTATHLYNCTPVRRLKWRTPTNWFMVKFQTLGIYEFLGVEPMYTSLRTSELISSLQEVS